VDVLERFQGSEIATENYQECPEHGEQHTAASHLELGLGIGDGVNNVSLFGLQQGHAVEVKVGVRFSTIAASSDHVLFELSDSADAKLVES